MQTVRMPLLGNLEERRLLDLGAGQGRHAFAAWHQGAITIAADLDDVALKEVARSFADRGAGIEGRPAAACLVADGRRLAFSNGAFDRVIVSEVLEHIDDDHSALAEVHRVLDRDGLLAVSVPRFWPEAICWILSREYRATPGGHVRIYRRSQLRDRLVKAGFTIIRSHHAHALHAPLWWMKCVVGLGREERGVVASYRRFLEWEILTGPRWVRLLERALNPLLGKSVVLYARRSR